MGENASTRLGTLSSTLLGEIVSPRSHTRNVFVNESTQNVLENEEGFIS